MKIALCIKQVPDTSNIKWTENNTMQREGVESIINPCDIYATELALKIKQDYGANITAFTMGPNQAINMLKNLIAIGVDNGVLISDKKFAGADTYATGKTIATSIKKILPDFDIIICGQFAIDGDTAQTGPCIASMLNIPQITYVKELKKVSKNTISVQRIIEEGTQTVSAKTPILICTLTSEFEPTRAKIDGIIKAQNTDITILTLEDLGLSPDEVGLKGSPTYVSKAFRPNVKHNGEKYFENLEEIAYNKIKEVIHE